jgi:cellular nucleic acid-binding protein
MADDGEVMELSDGGDNDDAFSTGTPPASPPPAKKQKTEKASKKLVDPALVEHAKKRLSKWAARLFDPDRPRGLVEGPQTIPLNDEFLTAFGRREKAFQEATGTDLEIDTKIESEDEDEETIAKTAAKGNGKNKTKSCGKVKINNLAYRTSGATLQAACEKFGPLEEVTLILDKGRQSGPTVLNSGRAYVTFEHVESAQACVDGLKKLDGRELRLSLASAKPKSTTGGPSSLMNRYWDKDISTLCYRCGKVGHIEPNCTNPAKARPCPLCGKSDHEQRGCPWNRICFNCGIPGHVNRECSHRRGLPKRMMCGICFQPGHHRLQCRSRPFTHAPDAVCMDCGRLGHFLCKELTWFYGLRGMSCFNCGGQGHSGYNCNRPTLFHCVQDPELTNKEIARAEAESL